MSCWKCGYRYLWKLEEGANRCPKCKSLRKWSDELDYKKQKEPHELKTAVDLKKSYMADKARKIRARSDHALGEPRIYKLSTSFKELEIDEVTSLGWRPYSKLETYQVSAPCQKEYFDRI